MGRQVHPGVAVLALLVILVVISMVYSRRFEAPAPTSAAVQGMMGRGRAMRAGRGMRGGGGGQPGAAGRMPRKQDFALGITYGSDTDGIRVAGFEPGSGSSPLQAMGVQVGDLVQSCNGKKDDLLANIAKAITGLEERGEPITLTVLRSGKTITLTRREKLRAAPAGD